MILQTKQEKAEFLKECYENIKRIYTSNLNKNGTDLNAMVNIEGFKIPVMQFEKEFSSQFPVQICFKEEIDDVKTGKLFLLGDIYNKVVYMFSKEEPIDLNNIFAAAKYRMESRFLLPFKPEADAEALMREQRLDFLPDFMKSTIFSVFLPKSEKFLEKYGFFNTLPRTTELHEAVKKSDKNRIHTLLSVSPKPDVEQRDKYGYGQTPLEIAASFGNVLMINLLIDYGCEVNNNCINQAILNGQKEALLVLLPKNKEDINQPDKKGMTPFCHAVSKAVAKPLSSCYSPVEHALRSISLSYFGPSIDDKKVWIEIIYELLKKEIYWPRHIINEKPVINYIQEIRDRYTRSESNLGVKQAQIHCP